jgi:hypothetical protein
MIYDNWNNPRCSNNPHIFTVDDLLILEEASESNLFARKFDIGVDAIIFDRIISKFNKN